MKILVTGASGGLGSKLCEFFLENGHSVIGFYNTAMSTRLKPECLSVSILRMGLSKPWETYNLLNSESLKLKSTKHH
jgi:nucleoside-diphosphate-sugar epimerase